MAAPEFEWDPEKADANVEKHGVTFDEAATVFLDPFAMVIDDPDHSSTEERLIVTGHSYQQRLITVVFVERGENVRIISARTATGREARDYAEGR